MVEHCDIKNNNSYFNDVCVICNNVRERGEGALPTWKTVNAIVAEDGEWKKTFTSPEHKFSIDLPADRSVKSINSLNNPIKALP